MTKAILRKQTIHPRALIVVPFTRNNNQHHNTNPDNEQNLPRLTFTPKQSLKKHAGRTRKRS